MKLTSLEAFCATVEEKSITGAARRMYLTQPSVSQRLAALEREAKVPILKRGPGGVEPTEQGMLIYEHACRLLDEAGKLERVLGTLRDKREARLYVAASSTLGEHLFPAWLRAFAERGVDAVPELFVGNTREVVSLVTRGVVSLGVIEGRVSRAALESVPFLNDELVVVVAPGHRWAKRPIKPRELSEEPFISREEGSGTREIIEGAVSGMGVELDVRMELGSTSAIKEAIEAGLGYSILSRETIRLEVESGHLVVVEGFGIPRRFTLLRNPATSLNPTEQAFQNYLLDLGRRGSVVHERAQ